MMTRQGKKWGYTTEIFRNAFTSAHHLEVRKGGFCSEHRHKHKYNSFYIIMGVLEITIWQQDEDGNETGIKDITLLASGQSSEVPTGLWHQFRAITKCDAIEMYQVLLEGEDIDRRTEGGLN